MRSSRTRTWLTVAVSSLVTLGCSASPDQDAGATADAITSPAATSPSSSAEPSASATPAPLTRAMAFQQGSQIIVVQPGGADPGYVGSSATGSREAPDWSADGSRIAFEVDHSSIWVARADGGGATKVFTCADPCEAALNPAWSPDGLLAFAVAETQDGSTTSRSAVVELNPATGEIRTVHEDTSGRTWLYAPRWSPDGTRLAFEADTFASDLLDESRVTKYAVGHVAAAGGAVTWLDTWTDMVAGPGSPSPDWSVPGIVYVKDDNLVLSEDLSSPGRQITHYDLAVEHAIQPTFDPEGEKIVFTHVLGTFGVDDRPGVSVLDLDTGDVVDLGVAGTHARLQP